MIRFKYTFLSLLLFVSMALVPRKAKTPETEIKLIYICDPMCSWCYAFQEEMEKLVTKYGTQMEIEIIVGGLNPYSTDTIDNEMRAFLKSSWEEINKTTGTEFKYDILKDPDFIYDTEPAARAVNTVKKLQKENTYTFLRRVQKMFYAENIDLRNVENYKKLCDEMKIDFKNFKELFESDSLKKFTKQEFVRSASLGIYSYPSLNIQIGSKHKAISRGYRKADEVSYKIEKELKKSNSYGQK